MKGRHGRKASHHARGGGICSTVESEAKSKQDTFGHGGKVEQKVTGEKPKARLDKPSRRAKGGRASADSAPFSGKGASPFSSAGHHAKGGRTGDHWIKDAIKKPGSLRRELGVKKGEKIPEKKLEKAENSDNPKLAKRAHLAETLKKLNK